MIVEYASVAETRLSDKNVRRVLSYGENLMLVEFRFAKGGVGTPHKHEEHDQVGYIAKGSFELTVGDETKIVRQGDSYYAPKNTLHGVVALEEDSVIVDAFTPCRADFL
ncbi:MAG: cupin domain-containing protein [Sporomusaceae bacterium]|nr:cupin domain-containing protein [Sporomusaceae bacterium]